MTSRVGTWGTRTRPGSPEAGPERKTGLRREALPGQALPEGKVLRSKTLEAHGWRRGEPVKVERSEASNTLTAGDVPGPVECILAMDDEEDMWVVDLDLDVFREMRRRFSYYRPLRTPQG